MSASKTASEKLEHRRLREKYYRSKLYLELRKYKNLCKRQQKIIDTIPTLQLPKTASATNALNSYRMAGACLTWETIIKNFPLPRPALIILTISYFYSHLTIRILKNHPHFKSLIQIRGLRAAVYILEKNGYIRIGTPLPGTNMVDTPFFISEKGKRLVTSVSATVLKNIRHYDSYRNQSPAKDPY